MAGGYSSRARTATLLPSLSQVATQAGTAGPCKRTGPAALLRCGHPLIMWPHTAAVSLPPPPHHRGIWGSSAVAERMLKQTGVFWGNSLSLWAGSGSKHLNEAQPVTPRAACCTCSSPAEVVVSEFTKLKDAFKQIKHVALLDFFSFLLYHFNSASVFYMPNFLDGVKMSSHRNLNRLDLPLCCSQKICIPKSRPSCKNKNRNGVWFSFQEEV